MDAGFFTSVQGFKLTSRRHRVSDDDAVDRINSFYVPVLIIILSSVIMTKMYLVGDPIQCWVPKQFTGAWEQYAESYCWVKNTYFVAHNDSIPGDRLQQQNQELKYYQWVPFVLALQALLFYVPSVLWKLLNWQSGIQLKSLVDMAAKCPDEDLEKRREKLELAARHLEFSVVNRKQESSRPLAVVQRLFCRVLFCGFAKSGSYLTGIYLLIKLLYIANCVGQLLLLTDFLGTDYKFYGVQVLWDLWHNRDWQHSGHFPRITMCDFDIRTLGNQHPWTLQCVLVVNLLNEKIFIFLWFLLVFVSAITIADAIDWLLWASLPSRRYGGMRNYVQPRNTDEARIFRSFTRSHIKPDGAFVLRMMAKNAGGPVVHDILRLLWRDYRDAQLPPAGDSGGASSDGAASTMPSEKPSPALAESE